MAKTGSMFRGIVMLALTVAMALSIAACGVKSAPKHPPDSDYPRKYPATK